MVFSFPQVMLLEVKEGGVTAVVVVDVDVDVGSFVRSTVSLT